MPVNKQIYILDTNVLLLDANSIYAYPNSIVIIPVSVVEELDYFKKQPGRPFARTIINLLDELRKTGSLSAGVELKNSIILKIWTESKIHSRMPVFSDMTKSSNRVLSATLSIQEQYKEYNVTLISNDLNLRIRAAALDLQVSNYASENLELKNIYEPMLSLHLDKKFQETLTKYDHLPVDDLKEKLDFFPNQHILADFNGSTILCRYIKRSNYLKKVAAFEEGVWNISPRNLEQLAGIDILMDKSIDIVALAGKAGTGKTLLALATALELMLSVDNNRVILVSRPIIPMGKDLGYLPGDIEEKISPWMQPIFDNLELLTSRNSRKGGKLGNAIQMLEKKLLELEALTYIRGRSIPNRFMIVDEAQNLTPHEAKTIVTRIGENTKLVLTGDPYQIDNPYVDLASNGLSYIIERLKPFEIAAHAYLVKGERSKLAELASNVL